MKDKKLVMYIFVNKCLGMSAGKMSAQVAHAAVEAYIISDKKLREEWRLPEMFYTKLVLEARDSEHLENILKYLSDRGIKTARIIDEGRTEIKPHQFTALGVEVVDKEEVGKIFEEFKLFKPKLRINVEWL